MIDFNLEYLSKQRLYEQRMKALKGYHDANVQNAVNLINIVYRKNQQYCLAISFLRISVSKRVKVEKLLQIQKIINRCYQNCFIKIKRYAVLANKSNQIKQENKLNYPLSILNRIYNVNRVAKLQEAWTKINKYKRFIDLIELRLNQVEQFCEKYQRRMFMRELFNIFCRVIQKKSECFNHMQNFQKIFEILRVKRLFIGLAQICVKTEAKAIADLQKDKAGKRDESLKATSKRNQIVNDLKRKTNNMKGQVNEETMRNNKKRADGSRQNGTKLMKKNQQLRGIEMGMTQALNEIERMEKQINRKQNFIKNRPKVSMPFQYLRGIYIQYSQIEDKAINKAQIDSKIGKGQLNEFINSSNYITCQNVRLKFIINLYEQIEGSKKSDSYTNLDNQNSCLKGLISSIVRMQYFQPKREKILKNVDEINSNLEDLKLQMSQIRVQKLEKIQSRRK